MIVRQNADRFPPDVVDRVLQKHGVGDPIGRTEKLQKRTLLQSAQQKKGAESRTLGFLGLIRIADNGKDLINRLARNTEKEFSMFQTVCYAFRKSQKCIKFYNGTGIDVKFPNRRCYIHSRFLPIFLSPVRTRTGALQMQNAVSSLNDTNTHLDGYRPDHRRCKENLWSVFPSVP